ncbi:MFS family permease [Aeromicrobium panaciterrae]|uniref:MFS family permease n=1 Tax=Aeromicrobium panaciterrae TaxID=363861 RepID=A0ABU1UNC8_9ACTN|nr:MFS transporter [Aeromicrobium panaciterrae]MDR7086691.1 MFS family permease [Aeromicrobium panaciterrae]
MTAIDPKDEVGDEVQAPKGFIGTATSSLRETGTSIASVFRNPALRRMQIALAGSMIGDWAYATAVAVWAYGVGGVTAVGVWTGIRLGLMAFTAPFGATFADRFPRKNVMIIADLTRVALVSAAVMCLVLETPPAPIFILATLTSLMGTPFRSAQRALTPSLAKTPDELTASNGTSSTIESLAVFIGPAIGALLIGATNVQTVFAFNALTFLWSTVSVLGIKVPERAEDRQSDSPVGADEPDKESFLSEVTGGFRTIAGNRDLLAVAWLVSAQTIVAGASAVMFLVMAVEILGTGPHGLGYLDSTLGVGAIFGGLFAIARAARNHLAQDLTIGVVLWALPLLLVTVWPTPAAVFTAVALLGLANPLVDVNFDTIVQRVTPDEVLGRVFGSLEACLIGSMALGAFVMPMVLNLWSLRTALGVVGVGVTVLALPLLPRMRSLDARLTAPVGLDLLRRISIFTPLSSAVVESLARDLIRVPVAAGGVVVREGDESDRFFIVDTGLVEVTQDGVVLRREGPGEFFGEIGLLRDVPRTATVTAVEDTVLQSLSREAFLSAVNGERDSYLAVDDIVTRRLTV